MSSNINLLIKEDVELLKHKKRIKIFRVVAIASLAMVLITSISIFLFNRVLQPPSVKEDKDHLLNQMSVFRKKEAKLTIVNDRVKNIYAFFNKRVDASKIINTFLGKVPDGISLEQLEFKPGTIAIQASSESLRSIDEFFNNLIDMARRKEIISAITLDSFSAVGEGGKYSLSINVVLI